MTQGGSLEKCLKSDDGILESNDLLIRCRLSCFEITPGLAHDYSPLVYVLKMCTLPAENSPEPPTP